MTDYDDIMRTLFTTKVREMYKLVLSSTGDEHLSGTEFLIKTLENICIFWRHISEAKSATDWWLAYINFIKLSTGRSFIAGSLHGTFKHVVTMIYGDNLQGATEYFGKIHVMLDAYEEVRNSPLFKKFYRITMFALCNAVFDKIGLTLDLLRYTQIEQEALKKEFCMGPDLVHCIMDTLLFVCERGHQCMVTGTLDPIFHSGSKHEEWYTQAEKLKRDALLLSNPEPHDINRFKFLSDLTLRIDEGKAIYKHATRVGDFERKLVTRVLNDLQMIYSNELTKKAAQQDRNAPFSVLLYGGSGVGKSTFTKLLFYHYGKVFNLPTTSDYKYTRNPVDPFWVNFSTSQWCVQLDDIAFMNPNYAVGGDPSVMEMLKVINNVPFVPTQADLADKGRTPMLARFVIATTNTENLNAHAYFSSPLAVRRRLPWIIDVKPKECYSLPGGMINTEALPHIEDGTYPDFWNITVKKIKAGGTLDKQHAIVEEFAKFDNILDFLKWFTQACREHEATQAKSLHCDTGMSKVELCDICFVPCKQCVCLVQSQWEIDALASVTPEGALFCSYAFWWFILACLVMQVPGLFYVLSVFFGEQWVFDLIYSNLNHRSTRVLFRYLGKRVQDKIGTHELLVSITIAIATILGSYKAFSFCWRSIFKNHCEDGVAQAQDVGSPPKPYSVERENVWYKDTYVVTPFDVPRTSMSWNAQDDNQVSDRLLRNCVHICPTYAKGELIIRRPNRAVCLQGRIYMTNNHALPVREDCIIELVQIPVDSGVNSNITFTLNESDILRMPQYDLAFFIIRDLPPKKSIIDLFPDTLISKVQKAFYMSRNRDGSKYMQIVKPCNYIKNYYISPLGLSTAVWQGRVSTPTENGQCGSLLVGRTGLGPVILGIHVLGNVAGDVGALSVTRCVLNDALMHFEDFKIQGSEPLLNTPDTKHAVSTLHFKSPLRYSRHGSAEVYGSLVGAFRPKAKSRVRETIIAKELCERLGWTITHGPPDMSWRPWYQGLVDLTTSPVKLDQKVLTHCVRTYTEEILSGLTTEDLATIHVYDNFTTINGAAGIAHVDKINRSTSAGFPWRRCKKFYLHAVEARGENLDPVDFDNEIYERIDIMTENYKKGIRACPVFSACLKDEALSLEKIVSGKTRIFTGAPMDWTFIVRKYCLSIVRLITNKRFLFECAVGTIAQSLEWEEIREYLVKFGEDRMEAGDFKKFDKQMPPSVILGAYEIFIALSKAAGMSEEDILVIRGIAIDTAFPLVDFNGDLIQLFGSNPSGNALTVVINSIANSLYKRYGYTILSPKKSCIDFRENVALITYGDDGVAGIQRGIKWFNHSTFTQVMANVGIGYTMADKTSKSIPFIHINEVSFLKRTWKWDEDYKAYIAPLDPVSIEKMLTVNVVSKTIGVEEQTCEIIDSAMREYAYYGRAKYDSMKQTLEDIACKNQLKHFIKECTFVHYDDRVRDFWNSSKHVALRRMELQSQDTWQDELIAQLTMDIRSRQYEKFGRIAQIMYDNSYFNKWVCERCHILKPFRFVIDEWLIDCCPDCDSRLLIPQQGQQ